MSVSQPSETTGQAGRERFRDTGQEITLALPEYVVPGARGRRRLKRYLKAEFPSLRFVIRIQPPEDDEKVILSLRSSEIEEHFPLIYTAAEVERIEIAVWTAIHKFFDQLASELPTLH